MTDKIIKHFENHQFWFIAFLKTGSGCQEGVVELENKKSRKQTLLLPTSLAKQLVFIFIKLSYIQEVNNVWK